MMSQNNKNENIENIYSIRMGFFSPLCGRCLVHVMALIFFNVLIVINYFLFRRTHETESNITIFTIHTHKETETNILDSAMQTALIVYKIHIHAASSRTFRRKSSDMNIPQSHTNYDVFVEYPCVCVLVCVRT